MSEVKGEPSHGGLEDMEIDDPRIYEEELEDVRRSALYSLLLVNYDYFEHEVLGRAQGEYRFLKETDKEWRAQKKGEVQPSKFNLDQFRGMGSQNRPVYLVIKTILEHARNTQHAEAAAEEYMRLRSMEKKLSKQFPRDFELEEKKVTESMVQRYRCPSGRFLRQAAEFKMVLLDEYNKLKETIDHQRNQISELSSRLSGITNQQIADGEIFTDIGDRNTPRMLGRRFGDVFEDQWTSAYETLKPRTGPAPKGEDDKEEYDEGVIVKLQDIVQKIYSFCKKTAEHQVNRLIGVMIPPIEDPLQNRDKGGSAKPSDDTSIQTERMARDFRKAMAPATVPLLQQEMETRIKESKIVPDPLTKEIKEYINTLVNIVWYMCIQQQPMEIIWGEKGKKFNKEQFRYSGKKGQKFGLTVWPAVLYHSEGPLASAGYAIPE